MAVFATSLLAPREFGRGLANHFGVPKIGFSGPGISK
jgi:hypothetical protein